VHPNDGTLRPYRAALGFSFFNGLTWMIGLGTPMVLLAGQLGASTFAVGLAFSFVYLCLPIQVLATVGLPRFGYKKQVVFAWSSRALFLLIPFGLAIAAPQEPSAWMAHLLVISVFFFSLFRALGSCGVMPWLYTLIPQEIRGRYFATDQSLTGFAGVFTLLACAALFAVLPLYAAFAWQYALAFLGSVLAVACLTKIPSVAKPRETSVREIVTLTPKLCTSPSSYRQYLVFMIVASLIGTSFSPFTAYYLKVEVGMPMSHIMLFASLQYFGSIVGAWFIRNNIDRFGSGPVFRGSLVVSIVIMLYWLLMVAGWTQLKPLLPLSYFAFGINVCFWTSAHLKYLPNVCAEEDRALSISVHGAVVGVLGGLAPMLWGVLLKPASGEAGMNLTAFILYFASTALIQVVLWFYIPKLSAQSEEQAPIQISAYLLRPFRYFGHLIDLVKHPKK
jgi:MFS family permease